MDLYGPQVDRLEFAIKSMSVQFPPREHHWGNKFRRCFNLFGLERTLMPAIPRLDQQQQFLSFGKDLYVLVKTVRRGPHTRERGEKLTPQKNQPPGSQTYDGTSWPLTKACHKYRAMTILVEWLA